MVHASVINAQISRLGIRPSRWFKPEIRELCHILDEDEEIVAFATGRYFGGFAVLAATSKRLLLVDKKPLFLSIEDIRYEMISGINFSTRLINANANIFTINKQHSFTSYKNRTHLRHLTYFVQQRVMSLQQNTLPPQSPQPMRSRLSGFSSPHYYSTAQIAQSVGALAHKATNTAQNPFTKNQMLMRRRWSRF